MSVVRLNEAENQGEKGPVSMSYISVKNQAPVVPSLEGKHKKRGLDDNTVFLAPS